MDSGPKNQLDNKQTENGENITSLTELVSLEVSWEVCFLVYKNEFS